ncbi:MAG: hypothetical protein JWM31_148 [Solirubrobacterales bacterium]|nr:hypothetical protein [Solirubrobacterales bacterium]
MTVLEELQQAEQRLIARVRELEPLVQEHRELVAELERRGLSAGTAPAATSSTAGSSTPKAAGKPRRSRSAPNRTKKAGASRAPRGGRAEEIQRLVAQNPGLTVKDLGERLGVEANGLYQPVRKLLAAGALRKSGTELHAVTAS